MLTTAKGLGNGFPCAALMLSPLVAASVKPQSLGTTFGGGPMACAAIEAVIAAIRNERLLERVRRVSAYIRSSCVLGPVTAHQGAGLLVGLRTTRPAKEIQAELLECCILTGTANDPHVLRLLPPLILEEQHVDLLRDALRELPHEALSRSRGLRARRGAVAPGARAAPGKAARAARAGRADPGAPVLQSVAAHAGILPGRHGAPRRQLVRHQLGAGQLATRDPSRGRDGWRGRRARARGHPGARRLLRRARHPRLRRRP